MSCRMGRRFAGDLSLSYMITLQIGLRQNFKPGYGRTYAKQRQDPSAVTHSESSCGYALFLQLTLQSDQLISVCPKMAKFASRRAF